MESKILITGANGFLGKSLCSFLQNNNISFLKYEGDITQPVELEEKISCIVHLAAKSTISSCNEDPKKCMDVNFTGTFNILEYAKKNNIKVIFPSSAGVYKVSNNPINEEGELDPKNYYAESKYLAEQLCYFYSSSFNLDIIVLRIFNPYGSLSKPSLIKDLFDGLINNQTVRLNSPNHVRDYIYINDLCSAFLSAIRTDLKGYNLINIGSGNGSSVQEVVDTLSSVSRKKLDVEYTNFRKGENSFSIADISKARKLLNFQPKYSLEDGLREMYKSV